ncbi:MAG TPA: peptidylprolyl isomerase [Patescibacteria group bacterium]|nr:peptidylprolyl isomerase [Patescibacteria group bacterium]
MSALLFCAVLISCEKPQQNQQAETLPEDTPPPIEQPTEQQNTAPITQDTALVTDIVTMNTSLGTITLGLYGKDAPNTVENFIELCKRKYYDGILFHRVAKGFVIQAGDPKTRDASLRNEWGTGGETWNEKPLIDELNPETPSYRLGYAKGTLAMGKSQAPNSARSQFFITTADVMGLPREYPIFGKVIGGMDVVEKIGALDVEPGRMGDGDGIPKNPPMIKSTKVEKVQ